MTRAALAVLAFALASCAPHALELSLTIAPDCAVFIPAGGSISYELVASKPDGGAPTRECGACISVTSTVASAADLLALLRAEAPACPIARDTSFVARVVAFGAAGCAAPTASAGLCASSPPVAAGGGHGDETLTVPLSCSAGCATACVPLSCADQGKDCGSVSDTCGGTLDCGSCNSPQKCGGAGVANVCGKP